MKFVLVVIFVVLGTAYSRSIPVKSSDISVVDVNGSQIPLIRKVRQFGGQYGGQYGQGLNGYGGYGGQYGQGQYGQGQYGQGQYGQGQYGQGQGQYYNNFDLNPFNDSPNNFDLNPFNNTFGKKKK
ncbi:shematrin-like protein 2 isoform X2 [Bradysia coprophila]|uniref:shematrin-like protein 2 isoform X2 n=1 Tax=Bradysia coprophila TaxID=38358 RepID=UPI00187D80A9|nr:shematrin-like protein 2 isoform X2 [Bradysia coprophila]